MKIPQKRYLGIETYEVLLEHILRGRWKEKLPGERKLCEEFKVSRPTLRIALNRLEKEGVLKKELGKVRKIIVDADQGVSESKVRVIGYLCPIPTSDMLGYTSRKIAAIEHYIHQQQLTFKLFVRPGCFTNSPAKALDTLTKENQVDCWILQQSNLAMQLWFKRNNITALVTGTSYREADISYVDIDNFAVCWHAVNVLFAKKRLRVCFLMSREQLPGDEVSEKGFKQAIRTNSKALGRVYHLSDNPQNISHQIDEIVNSSFRCDSIIVDKTNQTFSVVSHLLGRGIKIPEDIAIICRTESKDFAFMRPTIAHYSRNTSEFAKKTAVKAIHLANGEIIPDKSTLIIPDYVTGESV